MSHSARLRTPILSMGYFKLLILGLLEGLNRNWSHQQTADHLNAMGICTPSGLMWTAPRVNSTLKKVRLNEEYNSRVFRAMLHLVYRGELTVRQTAPLVQRRAGGFA